MRTVLVKRWSSCAPCRCSPAISTPQGPSVDLHPAYVGQFAFSFAGTRATGDERRDEVHDAARRRRSGLTVLGADRRTLKRTASGMVGRCAPTAAWSASGGETEGLGAPLAQGRRSGGPSRAAGSCR